MQTTSRLSRDESIPQRQRKYRYVKCTAPSDKRILCGKNYPIHQHKQHWKTHHKTKPKCQKTEPNCWKRYYAEIPGSVIKEQIPSKPRGRVLRNWLGKGNTNIKIKKEEEDLKERDPKRPRLRESKEVDESRRRR